MQIFTGIESNYFLSNKYLRSLSTNELYVKKNNIDVIPTIYTGIRYAAFELSWNYLKGITLKAGFPLNKSPL
jgi:hypothetical protein